MYGVDKLLPKINENSKIKVGKTWTRVIKYILPFILLILWISGVMDVVKLKDVNEMIIQAIITILIIVVPIILSKLPAKDKDDGKIKQ